MGRDPVGWDPVGRASVRRDPVRQDPVRHSSPHLPPLVVAGFLVFRVIIELGEGSGTRPSGKSLQLCTYLGFSFSGLNIPKTFVNFWLISGVLKKISFDNFAMIFITFMEE